MATFLTLSRNFWQVGDLDALQPWLPGPIQRVFYLYNADDVEWTELQHGSTWYALVCLRGSCRVVTATGKNDLEYLLENPLQCLVIEPSDHHMFDRFSEDAVLVALANQGPFSEATASTSNVLRLPQPLFTKWAIVTPSLS